MIIVRDIFHVKFGQANEATKLWKQAMASIQKSGYGATGIRLLTDLAGPSYYTLILESTFESLAQWEQAHQSAKSNPAWREAYQRLIPLTETGHREILTLIE
jgi:hypothetical protein